MLKKDDIIYNRYLKTFFRVVEATVYWDREDCHSLVKPKKKSKCLYRKWKYKVEPVGERWWELRSALKVPENKYLAKIYEVQNYRKTFFKIPPFPYSEDMSCIMPGCFELKGFKLLTWKQKRAIQVLYVPQPRT